MVSPPPAGPLVLGVSANFIGEARERRADLVRLVCRSGARRVREDLSWARAQPEPGGPIDLRFFEDAVIAAAGSGLELLPILLDPPAWAAASREAMPVRPRAFARFADAAVRRFGPRGSFWREREDLQRFAPTWWEVLNEPYLRPGPEGRPDPRRYAALVRAATRAMKRADPGVRVLAGAEPVWDFEGERYEDWIGSMLRAEPGLDAEIDALSVHPYSTGPPDGDGLGDETRRAGRLVTVLDQLRDAGGRRLPLWVTEIGWSRCTRRPECVSERDQARYLDRFLALTRTRWKGLIDAVFVYRVRDLRSPEPEDPEDGFGLRAPGGRARPAWGVLQRFAGLRR